MTRRYLDRKTKERYKRLMRSDDYPKHITEHGPKIPELDETLTPKRIIYLKDVSAEPCSLSEILEEKISELTKTAEETSRYIKQVNNHLDQQKIRIDELKKFQKIFEKQIASLDANQEAQQS
ncbi:MAG: hypothetical protein QXE84_01440 [Candidatus Nitrosotenuis sp.]